MSMDGWLAWTRKSTLRLPPRNRQTPARPSFPRSAEALSMDTLSSRTVLCGGVDGPLVAAGVECPMSTGGPPNGKPGI